jgi:hypothetical protein
LILRIVKCTDSISVLLNVFVLLNKWDRTDAAKLKPIERPYIITLLTLVFSIYYCELDGVWLGELELLTTCIHRWKYTLQATDTYKIVSSVCYSLH